MKYSNASTASNGSSALQKCCRGTCCHRVLSAILLKLKIVKLLFSYSTEYNFKVPFFHVYKILEKEQNTFKRKDVVQDSYTPYVILLYVYCSILITATIITLEMYRWYGTISAGVGHAVSQFLF